MSRIGVTHRMFFWMAIALLSTAEVGAEETLRFTGEQAEVQLEVDGRHSYVSVRIDGVASPLRFIIDTGSPINVIERRVAEELGLEVIGKREIGAPGGAQVEAGVVRVPLVRLGEATVHDAEFLTLDLEAMSGGLLQGVLGMGLFSEVLLELDPGRERAVVSRATLPAGGPGVIGYDASQSQIQVDLEIAGRNVKTNIDTGSPSSFTLPAELMAELPLRGEPREGPSARLVGGERSIRIATLDGSIRLGDLTFESPEVAFMSPSTGHGNIGNGILNDLVLRIDQKSHTLALGQPLLVPSAKRASGPRRLGIRFRGMPGSDGPLEVAGVDPGSLGERAGISAGDILVSLNGRPSEELDLAALRELFGGQSPLRIEVERQGDRQIIEID